MTEQVQLPFRQVRDQHRNAQAQGLFADLDLAQFSQLANAATGSERYSGGLSTGIGLKVKQASAFIDDKFDETSAKDAFFNLLGPVRAFTRLTGHKFDEGGTTIPDIGGAVGGSLGLSLFDNRELGEQIGRTLPRQTYNMLPLFAGNPIGLAGAAGLTGAHVFEQTGEADRALAAGATALVAPTVIRGVAGAAGRGVFNATGSNLAARTATIPASVVGGSLVSVMGQTADIALAPSRRFGELLEKEFWQTEAIASLAYLPLDIHSAYSVQFGRPTQGLKDAGKQLAQDEMVNKDIYVADENPTVLLPDPEGPVARDYLHDNLATPGKYPVDKTLFGLPYPKKFQSEFLAPDQFTYQVREAIGEGRGVEPQDSPPVAFREVEAKRPETKAEWEQHIEITNESRSLLGLPVVDDAMLRRNVQRQQEAGTPMDEALIKTMERLKYETSLELTRLEEGGKKARLQGDNDTIKMVARLNAVARLQPKLAALVASAKRKLYNHPSDPTLRKEIQDELLAFEKRATEDGAGGTDTARAGFNQAQERAKARVEAESKTKQKPGPAPREVDINETFTRVQELGPDTERGVHRLLEEYSSKISEADDLADVTRIVTNEIDKWLGFPDRSMNRLDKNLKSALIVAQRERGKRRKITIDDGDPANHFKQYENDAEGRDSLEAADENGADLMRLTRQNRVKNNFILGIDKVVKKTDDGQYVIGSEKRKVGKDGLVDKATLDSWMQKSSVNKAMWEAFKVAYPELFTGKKVDMAEVVKRIDEGEFLRVEVDGAPNEAPDLKRQRQNQLQHELETAGFVFDFPYYLTGITYKGTDITYTSSNAERKAIGITDAEWTKLQEFVNEQTEPSQGGQSFAEQFGFVAPDEYVPFDPSTGLGNTAVRVNLKGQNDSNHTYSRENIGWVRGKFIDHNGERVYRIDEVQSDAAQQHQHRQEAIAKGKVDISYGTGITFRITIPEGVDKYFALAKDEINVEFVDAGSAKERLLDKTTKKVVETEELRARAEAVNKEKNFNELLPSAQSIALRAGILHAIQNGAKKVFLPDGNTAMMTEGHDRAVRQGMTENEFIATLRPGLTPKEIEIELAKNSQPSQAGGMNLNYNKKLPNGAAKLLGVKSEFADLGRHKKSPLVRYPILDPNAESFRNLVGRRYEKNDDGSIQFVPGDSNEVLPASFGERLNLTRNGEFTQAHFDQLRLSLSAEDALRTPVLFNPDGTPQTNVTGRMFDLGPAKAKMEAEGGIPAVGRETGFDAMLLVKVNNIKPFLPVSGNKKSLLRNPLVSNIVASAVRGSKVVDLFSGSGFLSLASKAYGAGKVELNVRDPLYRKAFAEMKADPEGLAQRVKDLTKGIEFSRDGIKGDIKGAIMVGREVDPVAALVLAQLVAARQSEVNAQNVRVGSRTVGKSTIDGLSERFAQMAQIDRISGQDGWQRLGTLKEGEVGLVDPPYVGRGNNLYSTTGTTTVESRLANYVTNLKPANDNGAKLVVFDAYEPKLVQALEGMGFKVDKVQRGDSTPELVARNFDENAEAQTIRQSEAEHFLRASGMSKAEAEANSETVRVIANAFEAATGQKLTIGDLVDRQNRGVAGVSLRSPVTREVYLSKNVDAEVAPLVASHEIFGHQYQLSYERGQLSPRQRKLYEHMLKHWEKMSVSERKELLESFAKDAMGETAWLKVKDEVFKTAGNEEESMANLMGLIATQAVKGKNPYSVLRFLPQPIADFAISGMQLLKDSIKVVKAMLGYDVLAGKGSKETLAAIRKVEKQITKNFMDAQRAESIAKHDLGPIENFLRGTELDITDRGIDGNSLTGIAAELMNVKGSVKKAKGIKDKLVTFFDPVLNKALRHPVLKDYAIGLRRESENGHTLQKARELTLFGILAKAGGRIIVQKDMGPLGRIASQNHTGHAMSEMLRALQIESTTWEKFKFEKPTEYNEIINSLSAKERTDFESALVVIEKNIKQEQISIIDSDARVAEFDFATFIRNKVEGTNREVHDLAKGLFSSYRQARNENQFAKVFTRATRENAKDPNLWNLPNLIKERIGHTDFYRDLAKAGIDPEFAIRFLEPTHNAIVGKIKAFADKPMFVTERRMERFDISYNTNEGNANGRHSVATIEEAVAFVKEIRDKGFEVFYPGKGYLDTWKKFGKVNKGQADFDTMLDAAENRTLIRTMDLMLEKGDIDSDTHQMLTRSRQASRAEFSAEQIDAKLGSLSPHRLFTDGRKHLDMINQMLRYGGMLSKVLPQRETDAMFRFGQKDPAVIDDPRTLAMFEDMKTAASNFRTPDGAIGRTASLGAFVQYMLGNISSGVIEATQFPLSLSPMLTRQGASLAESYILPIKAINNITTWGMTRKWDSGINITFKGGRKVDAYTELMRRAQDGGIIGLGQRQEVNEIRRETMHNASRMSIGEKPLGRGIAKNAFNAIFNVGSNVYGAFTGFNERIGLLSAFDLIMKRDHGNSKTLDNAQWERIYGEAVQISQTANNSYGRIGRPVGYFDNAGHWRSASHTMWALNSYNAGLLSNVFANLRLGFGKNDVQGFTAKDRSQAKKAAIQAFATLVAGAGVLGGIPFADGITATLQQHTDLDIEKEMRQFFHDLGGEENGPWLADLATHGVLYAAGAPIDISSRVAIGGIPGINAYEGISPKALMGPAASIIEDYAKAGEDLLNGDIAAALEDALPLGLRKAYSNWRNDGMYRDSKGKSRFQLTGGEQVAQTLGFTPARVSQFQEQSRMLRNAELRQGKRNQRVYKEVAKTYRDKGPVAAKEALDSFVQKGDILNRTVAANGVIRYLNQERYGKDLREDSSLNTSLEATQINQTFGDRGLPQVTQQDRVMTNFWNQLAMGQVRDPQAALKSAFVTDMIMQKNTNMPFATARFLANQMTRPSFEKFQTSQELQQELLPFR